MALRLFVTIFYILTFGTNNNRSIAVGTKSDQFTAPKTSTENPLFVGQIKASVVAKNKQVEEAQDLPSQSNNVAISSDESWDSESDPPLWTIPTRRLGPAAIDQLWLAERDMPGSSSLGAMRGTVAYYSSSSTSPASGAPSRRHSRELRQNRHSRGFSMRRTLQVMNFRGIGL